MNKISLTSVAICALLLQLNTEAVEADSTTQEKSTKTPIQVDITSHRYSVTADRRQDKFVYVLDINGRFAVNATDSKRWRIAQYAGNPIELDELSTESKFFWLDEFQNIHTEIDTTKKQIVLDTSIAKEIAKSTAQNLKTRRALNDDLQVSRSWGTDLTYRVAYSASDDNSRNFASSSVLGFNFARFGRIQTTIDFNSSNAETNTEDSDKFTVRNTFYEVDSSNGYVFKMGEFTSGNQSQSPTVQLAGFSYGTNLSGIRQNNTAGRFGQLSEIALLDRPARLEVLVNTRQVSSLTVGAGSLTVNDIPLDEGINNVELVLNYLDGTTESITRTLLAGSTRIGMGRTEHYATFGWLKDSQSAETAYNAPYASASISHGLTQNNTLHLSAYGRGGNNRLFGNELSWSGLLPLSIEASSTVAASMGYNATLNTTTDSTDQESSSDDNNAGAGLYWSGFLQKRLNRSFYSFGLQWSSKQHRHLRQDGFAVSPAWSTRASYSTSIFNQSSLSASAKIAHQHDLQNPDTTVGVQFQTVFSKMRILASINAIESNRETDVSAHLSLHMPLGNRPSERLSLRHSVEPNFSKQTIRASKSLPGNELGHSWNAEVTQRQNRDNQDTAFGSVRLASRFPFMETTARVFSSSEQDKTLLSGTLAGSIVYSDKSSYFSYPVTGSFVVVDTKSTIPVSLSSNGRNLGKVNANGKLLIPKVSSHSQFKVEMNTESLPANFSGKRLSASSRFAKGLGKLSLPVVFSRQATARIVDVDGNDLPPGTSLHSDASRTGEPSISHGVIGNKGKTYLSDLATGESIYAHVETERCVLDMNQDWPISVVQDLEVVVCR